jgi:NitT/TauT family transport system permease protein
VLAGFAIAALSGTLIGVAIGWWRIVERTVEPTLRLARAPPSHSPE